MPRHLTRLESSATPLPVEGTFAGKHILLTGVTGFVGKVWLVHTLMFAAKVGKITVLIRDRRDQNARDRFIEIAERSPAFRPLRQRHGDQLGAFLASKISVVAGDVAQPQLGLADADHAALVGSVDAILHCAGLTDFQPDPRLAFQVNVVGAAQIAIFREACRDAKLMHISTCFVVGRRDGHIAESLTLGESPNGTTFDVEAEVRELAILCEDDSLNKKQRSELATERAEALGWANLYTFTKGLAEHLVIAADPTASILRPSIVECATDFPLKGWNEGINTTGPLLYLLKSWFRHMPAKPDNHYDVVPVDQLVRSMSVVFAATILGRNDAIYQIGSSGSNPVVFRRAIELANLAIRRDMRRSGSSRSDRFFKRFFDSVPAPAGDHAFALPRLGRYALAVQKGLEGTNLKSVLPPGLYGWLGRPLETAKDNGAFLASHAERGFGRVQRMLDPVQALHLRP